MSEDRHEPQRDELAAYLLDALEPGETAQLERHLAGCEACRTELEWMRPAVQVLPESVQQVEPSAHLRERLMEQVRSGVGEQRAGWNLRRPGGGLSLRPLAALAAVVLVLAAVVGYAIGGGSDESSVKGGMTTALAGNPPGVTAKMVSNGHSGVLYLKNIPHLPPEKLLQTWVERDDQIVSAGVLFIPAPNGTATATINDMRGVEAVMVTAEPFPDGSTHPTSHPIASVSIS